MPGFTKKLAQWLSAPGADRQAIDIDEREHSGRQLFFYNAFKALAFNRINGDYAEFGCHKGKTFALAWQESRRHGHKAKLWAFDSFAGLPEQATDADQHPAWKAGKLKTTEQKFHAICKKHGIPVTNYHVVPGFYATSLKTLTIDDNPTSIALAYIDCDLYSSTRDVLGFLMPRLKHGMIIAFDDYFCWSASQLSGERKAMLECFTSHEQWELVPYIQFGWHGQSFVVEDRNISGNTP
ncbi:MAG: TylF/MycF/NovP-related O-methyltransferase [Pseudomonadota bacterium]